MRLNLPPTSPVYDRQQANDAQNALVRAMAPVVTTDEAVPYIYLGALDGGVWKIEVSNTGVLTTAKVQG